MPIVIEVDESVDPRTTGSYEPDRIPQGFQAPDRFGRMRPNEFSGAKIGGGYDAPQGTPTWEPSWDQNAGITNQNLNGYKVMNAGWRDWINPFGNKIDELNVENQRLLKEMDDIRMHPLFPEPGPWNEFDPARREMEYYNDMMDMDDGGDGYDWDSSKGTEVAGTTEDKWGQLVRDGVVNPGDSLNPLQIDQLYNLYYEGGAGDMDQFGVT
tara:strand:+ start:49 stop:681 length:633 start_codon:yes stop_codon:yes gene_type:complete